jgi:hypothetical protein
MTFDSPASRARIASSITPGWRGSAPGPARSPVRGGPQSRSPVCPTGGTRTAFIPRPTELGAGQTQDMTAEGDWDLVCKSVLDLGRRFADA